MLDQAKMVMKMRKLQKELAKQIIEVESENGLVKVRINGEQKIKKINIDADQVDLEDIEELEDALQTTVKEAINKSQQAAAEKMRPMMGQLGNFGQ